MSSTRNELFKGQTCRRCASARLLIERFDVLKCQYTSKERFTFSLLGHLGLQCRITLDLSVPKGNQRLDEWDEYLIKANKSSTEGPFYNNEGANSLSSILTDRSVHQTPRSSHPWPLAIHQSILTALPPSLSM